MKKNIYKIMLKIWSIFENINYSKRFHPLLGYSCNQLPTLEKRRHEAEMPSEPFSLVWPCVARPLPCLAVVTPLTPVRSLVICLFSLLPHCFPPSFPDAITNLIPSNTP